MSLTPHPFGALVTRLFREIDERDRVFDLPRRRFVLGDPAHDLSVGFHGLPASTPFGPAAGPHTQLAQNIVLSWLVGGRILELKTIQVRDDLTIPRPCIDMATVGYNVEWSQELRLEQSLEEYVKAALLVRMLVASGRLPFTPGFDHTIFDLSVGYDLAGLTSERVEAFLRGTADARRIADALRREIPRAHRDLRDVDLPARLSRSVTLSTFHGCPPGEIVAMARHLMRSHGLHTIVKLNPTLLGPRETRRLLHDVLEFHDLKVPDRTFAEDTTWPQMIDMVGALREEAATLGLGFGLKLTNTLIVENHRDFFPASERQMYLSGPPLHVLTIDLLRRVREALGPELPISFSAGVDATNFADTVALDLVPVTVCTDMLKPGGYGRASAYFRLLRERMDAVGASCIPDFVIAASGHGQTALARLGLADETRRRAEAALVRLSARPTAARRTRPGETLAFGSPLRDAVGEAAYAHWRLEAAALNTASYSERVVGDPRYRATAHRRTPPKIGRRLQLFDCITCDKCVPVCPNDAIFTLALPRQEWRRAVLTFESGEWQRRDEGVLAVTEAHQIAIFSDFCNDCGNCDVFCPEDGGPYRLKPVFFGSEAQWESAWPADGFHAWFDGAREGMVARLAGREFRLETDNDRIRFRGQGFDVTFDRAAPEAMVEGHAERGAEVDLVYFQMMRALIGALRAPGAINYVSGLAEYRSRQPPQ